MKLLKSTPVLPALNMRETIDFYETKLGFVGVNLGSYAIVRCENTEIHFSLVIDKNKMTPSICFIYTDDIEDTYLRMAAKDLLYPKGQIRDMKFGKKEFSIRDNNNNIIKFGELPPGQKQ